MADLTIASRTYCERLDAYHQQAALNPTPVIDATPAPAPAPTPARSVQPLLDPRVLATDETAPFITDTIEPDRLPGYD